MVEEEGSEEEVLVKYDERRKCEGWKRMGHREGRDIYNGKVIAIEL